MSEVALLPHDSIHVIGLVLTGNYFKGQVIALVTLVRPIIIFFIEQNI